MIDLHHDLLSIMYYSYLRGDYSYLDNWIKNFNDGNVFGLLANLYFLGQDEMKEEMLGVEIDVVAMFKKTIEIFKRYLPNEKVIFSIEGCDYIKDTAELEKLYELGLRNILLVWNNPNKYGSGNLGDYGLTDEGKKFLRKAIDLGISIDMSHMNKKTFYDTINLIKDVQESGQKVKVIASHSNCYEICHHERNLDDEQLKALKSVGGLLGIVSYSLFVKDNDSDQDLDKLYLKHIERAISIMGIDNVAVSSDNMDFCYNFLGKEFKQMVFDYSNISDSLRKLLETKFSFNEINKIMYSNAYDRLFDE